MSKKQSNASTTTSKPATTKVTEKKVGKFAESYTRDKKVTSIVNTHPAPKRPNSKDSNSS